MNPYGSTLSITIQSKGKHSTHGLKCQNEENNTVLFLFSHPSTPAARIPKWRSVLQNSQIQAINNLPIHPINDIKRIIKSTPKQQNLTITLAPLFKQTVHPQNNTPIIYFNQLLTINYQHAATINNTGPWSDPLHPPPPTDDQIYTAMKSNQVVPRLTQKFLR